MRNQSEIISVSTMKNQRSKLKTKNSNKIKINLTGIGILILIGFILISGCVEQKVENQTQNTQQEVVTISDKENKTQNLSIWHIAGLSDSSIILCNKDNDCTKIRENCVNIFYHHQYSDLLCYDINESYCSHSCACIENKCKTSENNDEFFDRILLIESAKKQVLESEIPELPYWVEEKIKELKNELSKQEYEFDIYGSARKDYLPGTKDPEVCVKRVDDAGSYSLLRFTENNSLVEVLFDQNTPVRIDYGLINNEFYGDFGCWIKWSEYGEHTNIDTSKYNSSIVRQPFIGIDPTLLECFGSNGPLKKINNTTDFSNKNILSNSEAINISQNLKVVADNLSAQLFKATGDEYYWMITYDIFTLVTEVVKEPPAYEFDECGPRDKYIVKTEKTKKYDIINAKTGEFVAGTISVHPAIMNRKITKEHAIATANATDEVQEFLKLYPDVNVTASLDFCCQEIRAEGGDRECQTDPRYCWTVTYDKGSSWGYCNSLNSTAIRILVTIAINPNTGEILAKYPKLEYIKNATYCESDKDCIDTCCRCINYLHSRRPGFIWESCPFARADYINKNGILVHVTGCKCINNTCK